MDLITQSNPFFRRGIRFYRGSQSCVALDVSLEDLFVFRFVSVQRQVYGDAFFAFAIFYYM